MNVRDCEMVENKKGVEFLILCFYQNVIVEKIPVYLYNKISFSTKVQNINLRQKGLLTPVRRI